MMQPYRIDTTDVAALRRAEQSAREAGDTRHAEALARAILHHERMQREQAAGVTNPVTPWMGMGDGR